MHSLELLTDSKAIDEFAKTIANKAQAMRGNEIANVNDGIETTEALNAHLRLGRDVEFDYQRLIDEAKCYR